MENQTVQEKDQAVSQVPEVKEKEPKQTLKALALKGFGCRDEAELVKFLLGKGFSAEEAKIQNEISFLKKMDAEGYGSSKSSAALTTLVAQWDALQRNSAEKAKKRGENALAVFITWAKETPTGKSLA
jgi:hypothetical protein